MSWRKPESVISSAIAVCSKVHWRVRGTPLFTVNEDIVVLAVARMAGISRAHAFEQGNKRTAFAAMRLFLHINGYDTAFDDSVSWAERIIDLVEHRASEEEFARVIRPFVVAIG